MVRIADKISFQLKPIPFRLENEYLESLTQLSKVVIALNPIQVFILIPYPLELLGYTVSMTLALVIEQIELRR